MAEYPATSVNPIGNFNGHCLISLDGAAITVKRMDSVKIASWPYNCIRQFRAEDQNGKFSFISGRRGPFGVAEYIFSLAAPTLTGLQEALTQFTGAQFSDLGSNTKQRPPSTSSLSGRSSGSRSESVSSELSKSIDGVFSPSHSRVQSARSPKHSASTSDVFGAKSTYDVPLARAHFSASDVIPESSPYDPQSRPRYASPPPKETWVLDSHSYESLPANKGKPKPATRPKPAKSTFSGPNALYDTSVPKPTGGSSTSHPRLSPDEDVSRDGPRSASPKSPPRHRTSPDIQLSPQTSITSEDLPSDSIMKHQSEMQSSTLPIRRRRHDYEDADFTPRRETARKSDPGSQIVVDTTYDHLPTPKRVSQPVIPAFSRGDSIPNGKHTDVVKKLAQLAKPDTPELLFGSPEGDCSDLDLLPRNSPQFQSKMANGRRSPEDIKQLPHGVHPRDLDSQSLQQTYAVPRSLSPATLYSSPRGTTEDPENVYNVPRSLQEGGDEGLYKVPKKLSAGVQESVYSVPRSYGDQRDDVYNIPRRRSDGNVHLVKAASSMGDLLDDSSQMNYDVPPSHPRRDESSSLYNVPKKVTQPVRREKAYEDIDFAPRKNGRLRPSRSFESLFNRRIRLMPNPPRTFSPPNLPSPTSKGIYIDLDTLERERRGENLYAEISDKPQPRYVTSPRRSPLPPTPETTPPSSRKFPPAPSVPESPSSALYATIPGDDERGLPRLVSSVKPYPPLAPVDPMSKAKTLAKEGYELCLPADENTKTLPPRTISPSRNAPKASVDKVAYKYGLQLVNGMKTQSLSDRLVEMSYTAKQTCIEGEAIFQPSSSGPVESCPLTDEYVIITKSDPRDRSEPQAIPGKSLVSAPAGQGMEEYEMMHPAQLAMIRNKSPSPKPGTKGDDDFDFPGHWTNSPTSSTSSLTGSEGRHRSVGSLPREGTRGAEKMRLAGSVSSPPPFATMPRRRITSGDSSDSGPFSPPHFASIPLPPRRLVKVASGSPSDRRPSTELRSMSRSVGIMLDVDKHTYVNVSNEPVPLPKQPNAGHLVDKKPVPVPRSALLRADVH